MTVFDTRPEAEGRWFVAYPGPPLSRSGHLALYRQIADRLRQVIATGVTRLPTERRLAEDFAVARVTVRLALDLLAADQLISRRPRFGTRVIAAGAAPREGASQLLKTERTPMVSIPVDRSCLNDIDNKGSVCRWLRPGEHDQ
jgi:DNA-binding transcriptional MocR family regulator